MPENTYRKNQSEGSTKFADEQEFVSVPQDDLVSDTITVSTSGSDNVLVAPYIGFVTLTTVYPEGKTIVYSLGSANSEKDREIKKANEVLSEGAKIDIDLAY